MTAKNMWLKITQLLKEQIKEIRNMNASQSINSDLSRSFFILLAITVLSFEATDLFYKIISIPLTKQIIDVTSQRISSSTESNQRRQLQDYSIITERNLFLTTLKEAGGNEAEGGIFDSGQKAADFDLKGTVACNSSFGFIIVEERENHKQKLYRLGEKIGSRKLVKITRNTAVLKNEEGEVTLKIKETMEAIKDSRYQAVVVYPNADAGGRKIIEVLEKYRKYPFIHIYKNLPRADYLELMKIQRLQNYSHIGVIK